MNKLIFLLGVIIIGVTVPVETILWDEWSDIWILVSLFVGGIMIGLSRTIDKKVTVEGESKHD